MCLFCGNTLKCIYHPGLENNKCDPGKKMLLSEFCHVKCNGYLIIIGMCGWLKKYFFNTTLGCWQHPCQFDADAAAGILLINKLDCY